MQPFQSPYLFSANNPNIFIEQDGNDNVIYIVFIGAQHEHLTLQDKQQIIARVNEKLDNLGLKTRAVLFDDSISTRDFKASSIDSNDTYGLFGDTGEIQEFLRNSPDFLDFKADVDYTKLDSETIELSSTNIRNSGVGQGFIVNTNEEVVNQKIDQLGFKDFADYYSWLILHSAYHNTGHQHGGVTPNWLAKRGKYIQAVFYSNVLTGVFEQKVVDELRTKLNNDVTNIFDKINNPSFKEDIEGRFGKDREHVVNYKDEVDRILDKLRNRLKKIQTKSRKRKNKKRKQKSCDCLNY